ncbi:ATP-dependent helicase [Pseudomonas sp. TNT2022 ID1044]|uniref:UvrD-helicase domain-containing protein n=1 Tax=Pseudomonas sp. TNT2022 ID1044 TaxID=2942636 RepID=UPI00235F304C|nr:ATP-dependent helicase [Pseudomonas sp. TNT2022 ID1044]MDD0995866.1 ATP-dependent helicase [Pseudomonas sp. TNT2022 ID1044]
MEYTEEQKEAIKPQGSLVITACPGSGKTAVIAQKIRNELDAGKTYQGVIAITFTRKASKELEGRCRQGSSEVKGSFFGTIDSFCLSEIIYPFLRHILGPAPINAEPKYNTDLNEAETALVSSFISDKPFTSKSNLELIKQLYMLGVIYFPAIPELALYVHENSLACRHYLKARYTTIYIDEYQDSSKAQHELFLSIVRSGLTGVAVGDLQQSIYGWRNCSPEFLKELIRNEKFTHRTVSINHRCHPSISNYANRLFNPAFTLSAADSIKVWQCNFTGTQRDSAVSLNSLIPAILSKSNKYSPSDVVVLVRNNRSLGYLRDHLSIPCRVYSDDAIDTLQSRTGLLWSALLKYRFDHATTPDQILEHIPDILGASKTRIISARKIVKKARSVENQLLEAYLTAASKDLLGIEAKVAELAALKKVTSDTDALRQYSPTSTNEIQCMTLHKAKGLEFEIVIHLDLCERDFPYQRSNPDGGADIYPDWEQDLNLHYAGITRAKSICILGHTTSRITSYDKIYSGAPSPFLRMPGLHGLYGEFSYPQKPKS